MTNLILVNKQFINTNSSHHMVASSINGLVTIFFSHHLIPIDLSFLK
ncbi:hypothetical protein HNQ02_002379 [Flavobacterium sp. 7E]|nr:hypothetical protein [Flavobacterium sp. PL002]NRS89450.1 hypothetical protein [Flavobacterium sp. 7E]